jgi:phosphopantetheinyl transferase (holo-ACP synthase)
MLGIDLTRISRFEKIDLNRLGHKLGHELDSPKTAAKVWAIYEALTKAEGRKINPRKIKILFKVACAPTVHAVAEDPIAINTQNELSGDYILSLTHEGDYVAVVALRRNKND